MIKFDHIIHYVNQLDEVRDKAPLPIHTGGVHTRLGTENLLSYLDTRYIEYISIKDEKLFIDHVREAEDSFAKAIYKTNYTNDFIRYALAVDDIIMLRDRYKAQGYETLGPLYMERETDGETLRWSLLYIMHEKIMFPFFIQWEEPESKRIERIKGFGVDMKPAKVTIRQEVEGVAEWRAFFDVIGVWKGEIDNNTTVALTEGKSPAISVEMDVTGKSGKYMGADYKFI